MLKVVGFDSRIFKRNSIKRDGGKGSFKSVVGFGIRVEDYELFDKKYQEILKKTMEEYGFDKKYNYYCVNDFKDCPKKDEIIEATGLFEKLEYGSDLLYNILKINEIRNKYSHTFHSLYLKEAVLSKILNMKLSKRSYDSKKEIPPNIIRAVSRDPLTKFRIVVIESATQLTRIIEKLQKSVC